MAIFSKTEEKDKKESGTKAQTAGGAKIFAGVLLQPRISEKSSRLNTVNKYVFNVLRSANKIEIKKAVEKAYNVKVTQVNVVNVKSKVRNYGRISGRTSAFRKAVVTLKQGDKIEGATETI